MRVATVKVTFDRETGEKLEEEVVDVSEVDEDEYYRPIAEFLYKKLKEAKVI
ncbi:hypothetical protein [Caldanaerobius polysaccharolyticus]|uniref:hypothetical protein n=1 Tax=Caldanaerobius polysaccharolyticus TaxID=44256 RepID=UPI00146FC38A|nr:hypothetical protein [Caldanaerobius polysaccharolyticus]